MAGLKTVSSDIMFSGGNVSVGEPKRIQKLRQIVREHQYQKIDGSIIDATSAHAMLLVYDNLSPVNREKFSGMMWGEFHYGRRRA